MQARNDEKIDAILADIERSDYICRDCGKSAEEVVGWCDRCGYNVKPYEKVLAVRMQ